MSGNFPSEIWLGLFGGGAAGLVLWLVGRLNEYEIECRERRRIFKWLDKETKPEGAQKWRSTRTIASYNNLTLDRVRFLCSIDPRIVLSTKEKEVWGILGRARDS